VCTRAAAPTIVRSEVLALTLHTSLHRFELVLARPSPTPSPSPPQIPRCNIVHRHDTNQRRWRRAQRASNTRGHHLHGLHWAYGTLGGVHFGRHARPPASKNVWASHPPSRRPHVFIFIIVMAMIDPPTLPTYPSAVVRGQHFLPSRFLTSSPPSACEQVAGPTFHPGWARLNIGR
jgi:hypothetical protein